MAVAVSYWIHVSNNFAHATYLPHYIYLNKSISVINITYKMMNTSKLVLFTKCIITLFKIRKSEFENPKIIENSVAQSLFNMAHILRIIILKYI